MTSLNPQANAFVPSTSTLRLATSSSSFPPPQLESLYLTEDEIQIQQQLIQMETNIKEEEQPLDFSNFDLKIFFEDMLMADNQDLMNYLPYRAEYLLGYANQSDEHALEVVQKLFGHGLPNVPFTDRMPSQNHQRGWNNLRHQDDRQPLNVTLAQLASEMVHIDEDDGRFQRILLEKLNQELICGVRKMHIAESDYHRSDQEVNRCIRLCKIIGCLVRELHIGTCIRPTSVNFAEHLVMFFDAICASRKKLACDVAFDSLGLCAGQIQTLEMKSEVRRRLKELLSFCSNWFVLERPVDASLCPKRSRVPVAQLDEEEAEDFDKFLTSMSQQNI